MNNICCPLTLYHTIPTSKDPEDENTVGKGKMLITLETRIFSFSDSVFYSIIERNPHFSNV